jgi:S-adenosylmethionine:tRNA ribosyltransferase-isomerase
MRVDDFEFDLPEDLIALRPARPRSSARLLAADPAEIRDLAVTDLPALLRPGDLLVLNDTRVIPARLVGERRRASADGAGVARIEATLIGPHPQGGWSALLKPLRRVRDGEVLHFGAGLSATVAGRDETAVRLAFDLAGPAFEAALARAGAMPLPPYIAARRAADEADAADYQTVWARRPGAVASPTASLHFDSPLLAALRRRGVETTHVTLHVGAGTFLPVRGETVAEHRMHAEWGEVTPTAAEALAATRRAGGRVIPVGTTALRIIETAAAGGEIAPFSGETDIFITPGYRFRAADALMTNFHLPRSTLMMLVSAMMGTERIRQLYRHAIDARYRFFSYGDASILFPGGFD